MTPGRKGRMMGDKEKEPGSQKRIQEFFEKKAKVQSSKALGPG